MKKVVLLLFVLFFISPANADIYSATTTNKYLTYCDKNENKKLSEELEFAENQMFSKTYSKDTVSDRLERLETAVYGAIQDGDNYKRIKKIKKAVTNVASGGNGLNYETKTFNQSPSIMTIAGCSSGYGNWYVGSDASRVGYNHDNPNGYHHFSHRLPKRNFSSHRLPLPYRGSYSYSHNPIGNSSVYKNYSIGTGVKILND